MNPIAYPEWRWDRVHAHPTLTGGPERVQVREEDPKFVRRPVGFTAALEAPEQEPATWEGDNA